MNKVGMIAVVHFQQTLVGQKQKSKHTLDDPVTFSCCSVVRAYLIPTKTMAEALKCEVIREQKGVVSWGNKSLPTIVLIYGTDLQHD